MPTILSREIMDPSKLPWKSAAVVLWLPHGEEPNGFDHLNCGDTMHPPQCNPNAWWDLEQAVTHASTSNDDHNKRPWIKVGEAVLSPDDVLLSYDFYKHHGTRK
jgi:hypothetical protein